MPSPRNSPASRRTAGLAGWPKHRVFGLILAVQAALLAVAAVTNQGRLNTDGVAYLRLAHYYAEGPLHLAVSGYWGPMLSWLIAPLLAMGLEPPAAARAIMALTALAFTGGCLALLRSLALPGRTALWGTALAALAGVGWSVEFISPDLLVAGLICAALAAMISTRWPESPRWALLTGALWGLAYLAKAVALPLAAVLGLMIALAWHFQTSLRPAQIWRQLGLTWLACVLVAAPWMVALSLKYDGLTFSTSAKAAHAVVGPPDVDRYHPYARTFHHPEEGRITAWEDPTSLPYATWSPFSSGANFQHQLRVSSGNVLTAARLLGSFDVLHLGVLAGLGLGIGEIARQRQRRTGVPPVSGTAHAPHRGTATTRTDGPPGRDRRDACPTLRAALCVPLLLAGLAGVYLPAYLGLVDQRYFYASFPLLFAAAALAADWMKGLLADRSSALGGLAWPLVLVSFAALPAINALAALQGGVNPAALVARSAADGIAKTGRPGPVAGSGLLAGDRTGVFTAFLLDQPWFGDKPDASADDFAASGAHWVMVQPGRPVAGHLANDARFAERTTEVLKELELPNPEEFLRVFERKTLTSPAAPAPHR